MYFISDFTAVLVVRQILESLSFLSKRFLIFVDHSKSFYSSAIILSGMVSSRMVLQKTANFSSAFQFTNAFS